MDTRTMSVRSSEINRKEQGAMKAAQLETMANAILDGKLSVDGAERMLGGKVVHTATRGPAEATDAQKAHVRVTRIAAANAYTQRKHAIRVNPTGAADDESVERYGGQRLWPDQATEQTFHNFLPHIAEDVLRDQAPTTFDDPEVTEAARDRWNVLEVARLRFPLVAFRPDYRDPSGTRKMLPGDRANGYVADETWIEGQSRLDAELRLPHQRVTRDWQRDAENYIVLDAHGSRTELVEESTVMGATQWEYRRRGQGRQPWMSAKTYGWVMQLDRTDEWMRPERMTLRGLSLAEKRLDREYRAAARQREAKAKANADRAALIQLIDELGGDPKAPKVVAWVKANGITNALAKLQQRATQVA